MVDKTAVGRTGAPFVLVVERGKVLEYARAVHAEHPDHRGEAPVVPPTFLTTQLFWEEQVPDVPIVILESPYRALIAPFLAYIDALDRANPGARITVVLPEFVPAQPWQRFLHNQPVVRLRHALQARPNTVVVNVPYHLR